MKYAASILVLAAPALAKFQLKDNLTDAVFIQRFTKDFFNGFIKGLYHQTKREVVDEDCFGDWMFDNVNDIYDFGLAINDKDWSVISYDSVSGLAQEGVDLMFMNQDACRFA